MIDKRDVDPALSAEKLMDIAEKAEDFGTAVEMLTRAWLAMDGSSLPKDDPLVARWEGIYSSCVERMCPQSLKSFKPQCLAVSESSE
jgi:hypothetical protein